MALRPWRRLFARQSAKKPARRFVMSALGLLVVNGLVSAAAFVVMARPHNDDGLSHAFLRLPATVGLIGALGMLIAAAAAANTFDQHKHEMYVLRRFGAGAAIASLCSLGVALFLR